MDNPLVMTFDVGTQSVRAMLVNKHGEVESSCKLPYGHPSLPPKVIGEAEQYPDFYYDKVCEASVMLKGQNPALFSRVVAVTITCIRDTVLILDKDHKPLRNIIMWMDCRRAPGKPNPPFLHKFLLWLVGMRETVKMLYKDAYFNWIRECEPELWAKTDKFVMLPGYINYKLTGVLKDGVANQVGHIPFDNRKRTWMKKGLARCVADIPLDKLIDLTETGTTIGYINAETARRSAIPEGLPLIATGTDKACEALGLSVVTQDKAALSLGTAATIQFCTPRYFEPEPFLPSYPSVIPGYFNAENQIYRGYWMVTWFIDQFCSDEKRLAQERGCSVEEILDAYMDDVPPGCDGLIMTPHLAPGAGNPYAKGIITGLSDTHSKKHLYRAIIEGLDFELYHAMKRMELRSGQRITCLYAGGGGSISNKVLQMTADIFGLPVKRTQTNECSGLGSSIAAFVGLGVYRDFNEAVCAMTRDTSVFIPDPETHKLYSDIYKNVYNTLERKNTSIFRAIRKLRRNS